MAKPRKRRAQTRIRYATPSPVDVSYEVDYSDKAGHRYSVAGHIAGDAPNIIAARGKRDATDWVIREAARLLRAGLP